MSLAVAFKDARYYRRLRQSNQAHSHTVAIPPFFVKVLELKPGDMLELSLDFPERTIHVKQIIAEDETNGTDGV